MTKADLTKKLGNFSIDSIDEEEDFEELSETDPVQYRSLMDVKKEMAQFKGYKLPKI